VAESRREQFTDLALFWGWRPGRLPFRRCSRQSRRPPVGDAAARVASVIAAMVGLLRRGAGTDSPSVTMLGRGWTTAWNRLGAALILRHSGVEPDASCHTRATNRTLSSRPSAPKGAAGRTTSVAPALSGMNGTCRYHALPTITRSQQQPAAVWNRRAGCSGWAASC
jgi:hypothetical protein